MSLWRAMLGQAGAVTQAFQRYEGNDTYKNRRAGWLLLSCIVALQRANKQYEQV